MPRKTGIVLAVSLALGVLAVPRAPAGIEPGSAPAGNGGPALRSDFNGDGFSDVAIGVPSEDLGAAEDAGIVHVLYGAPDGLVTLANEIWNQDSTAGAPIFGTAETGDRFGEELATGDFDRDGFADLAIAAPGEDFGSAPNDVGQVHILYGSSNGLSGSGNELLWQEAQLDGAQVKDKAEEDDRFGFALAVGNFGKSRADDLAVGIPGENPSGTHEGGAVAIFYSNAEGMSAAGNQLIHQDSVKGGERVKNGSEDDDQLGDDLVAGNFGKSTHDDIAVAASNETIGTKANAGAVNVIYGAKKGATLEGNQIWHQDVSREGVSIQGRSEDDDHFGLFMAAGDFGKSEQEELAVGVVGETVSGIERAGAVNVIYGTSTGLSTKGNQIWHQDSPGGATPVQDQAEEGDQVGSALIAADFGRSGKDDLVIGVPFEWFEPDITLGGAVHVLYGRKKGLGAQFNEFWHQDITGVDDTSEDFDLFGVELTWGYFDSSPQADLVVGVNREDIGAVDSAGAINVIYGGTEGLTETDNQFLHQDSEADSVPIQDEAEEEDFFGGSLSN